MKADKNKVLITSTGKQLLPQNDNATQKKLVASLADDIKIAIYEDSAIHNKDLPEPEFIVGVVNLVLELIYDNYKFGK